MKKLRNWIVDTFIKNYPEEKLDEIYREVSRRPFNEESLYQAFIKAGINSGRARREAEKRTFHLD